MRFSIGIAALMLLAGACKKDVPVPQASEAGVAAETGQPAGEAAGAAGVNDAVEAVVLDPAEPKQGESILAKVSDSQNRMLNFSWFSNDAPIVGQVQDRLAGSEVKKGARIKVRVQPQVDGAFGKEKISESVLVGNTPPLILSIAVDKNEGGKIRMRTNAEDHDGDTLSYRLLRGPQGMTVDAEGVVEWTMPADFSSPVSFAVSASDGQDESVMESTIGSR